MRVLSVSTALSSAVERAFALIRLIHSMNYPPLRLAEQDMSLLFFVTKLLCLLNNPSSARMSVFKSSLKTADNFTRCSTVVMGSKSQLETFAYGHTTLNTPVLVRSLKLSNVGLG